MAVAEEHRFLAGKSVRSFDARIVVLAGTIDDWFYHDLLHGCLSLRQTLALWALHGAHGAGVFVALRADQVLDFADNPDPIAAEARFRGATAPKRPPKYGNVARPTAASQGTAAEPSPDTPTQSPLADAQPAAAANAARQAAGGVAQSLRNTLTLCSQALASETARIVLLIEDIVALVAPQVPTQEAMAVAQLVREFVHQWHGTIASHCLVVLPTRGKQVIQELLPTASFPNVVIQDIAGPAAREIAAALERLCLRHGFDIVGTSEIANKLTRHNFLQTALRRAAAAVGAHPGHRLTLDGVLQLPPVNEGEVARIHAELEQLIGLGPIRELVRRLEGSARAMRMALLEGGTGAPSAGMHLVFTGNPGTGKTTVARIVGRLYHAVGILPKPTLKELKLGDLTTPAQGGTAANVQTALMAGVGGVIFWDEAQQLGDGFSEAAKEAVKVLYPIVENLRHEMVFILAGYSSEMHKLFAMDQGLAGRFPEAGRVEFPDYTEAELWSILVGNLSEQGLPPSVEAERRLRPLLHRACRRPGFDNARGVRNLVSELKQRHDAGLHRGEPFLHVDDLPPLVKRNEAMYAAARAELDGMLGLAAVKAMIDGIVVGIEYDLAQEATGSGQGVIHAKPRNLAFLGSPGTGKTEVARLLPRLLHGLGAIERPSLVECGPAQVIGNAVGETEKKLDALFEQARGGVLFIDEAYSIAKVHSYGENAIHAIVQSTLHPANAGTVVVIAGYEQEMRQLLAVNSGMAGRFPLELKFDSFTPSECAELAVRHILRAFSVEDGARARVELLAASAIRAKGRAFESARWSISIADAAVAAMKTRVIRSGIAPEAPASRRVTVGDFPAVPADAPARVITAPRQAATSTSNAAAVGPAESLESLVAASTFQIMTEGTDDDGAPQQATATGFFLTADGVMATSRHVVDRVTELCVLCGPDRSPLPANVVSIADDADLAIIRVAVPGPVAFLRLGESAGLAALGEALPVFGFAHVTPGEPGRFVRVNCSRNDPANVIQFETDGDVEPGFSGGPVLDVATRTAVGVCQGAYGRSARVMVRAERLRALMETSLADRRAAVAVPTEG